MSKGSIVAFSIVGAVILGLIVLIGGVIGKLNSEGRLRVTIENKITDNKNEYDAMWKTISQTVEVSEQAADRLKEIFVGYAEARTGKGGGNELVKWVTESVPNVQPDSLPYKNLMNIIVAGRENFKNRQKELIDLKRAHDTLFDGDVIGGAILGVFGRHKVEIKIVTSTKTEKSFETGKDDDVGLYRKNDKVER